MCMRGQTCGMNCHEIHMEYEDAQERRQRQECKSAKDGAPSAKVRAPSAKVRAPSAKVRVPSAKVRVPSVKVQAPTDSSGRKLPRSQVRPRGGQGGGQGERWGCADDERRRGAAGEFRPGTGTPASHKLRERAAGPACICADEWGVACGRRGACTVGNFLQAR